MDLLATHTIERKNRDLAKLVLDETEAWAMLNKGFRFAEFNPETDVYRLALPYRVMLNMTKDTITLEQA
jgi:hypothetical protein